MDDAKRMAAYAQQYFEQQEAARRACLENEKRYLQLLERPIIRLGPKAFRLYRKYVLDQSNMLILPEKLCYKGIRIVLDQALDDMYLIGENVAESHELHDILFEQKRIEDADSKRPRLTAYYTIPEPKHWARNIIVAVTVALLAVAVWEYLK